MFLPTFARILRRLLGLVAGIAAGAFVNMWLLGAVASLVPPPDGVDPNDLESIRAHIGSYEPIQFVAPFVAHAGGTVVGAFLATLLGGYRNSLGGLVVGVVFLAGGIGMVLLLPETPAWFKVVDLTAAYLPMGWLGWRIERAIHAPRA